MKPALRDVTVCAADCQSPALAGRALGECVRACDFGDAILFTDAPLHDCSFRTAPIPRLASAFSYERSAPARSTFGFHGAFNLWRHVDHAQMPALAAQLPDKVARARTLRSREDIQADARRFARDPRFLVLFDATCERAGA